MASQERPADRKGFRFAIICALPREADAITLLFDQFWDEEGDYYGRADGDTNSYITGRIGNHHVVLAVLPGMGTNSAAAATASLRSSYTGLKLALLVGVCGGVPRIMDSDACLGDVVLSKTVVQYDYGRQYPGHFAVKDTVEDSLGRANKDIQSLLAVFETEFILKRLQAESSKHLKRLQEAANKGRRQSNYQYPGREQDRLYHPLYVHRHRRWCSVCANDPDIFCESASKAPCAEAGCDPAHLVMRESVEDIIQGGDFSPKIFIGRIGSGNTVMKSGEDRDRIATKHNLIAFEMEGAGAWDEIPCIVVKGICDYADSHKNKAWQHFAAATAACVAKAILGRYAIHDGDQGKHHAGKCKHSLTDDVRESCYYIPLTRNMRFIGRSIILDELEDKFFGQYQSRRVAIVGLGGVGKTQIALQFAYQTKEKRPDYSIFWVPVLSGESADRAYAEISKKLGLQKRSEDDDVKDLVCQHLSSDKAGKWLFIVDNADDPELILGSQNNTGLVEHLPESKNGIILLTTRSGQIAGEFAQSDVIDIEQMDKEEATTLLRNSLIRKQLLHDEAAVIELLTYLAFLPLAITQAAAYLNQTKAPIRTYLSLLRNAEDNDMRIFEREFRDNFRYRESQNAVGTTWIVSFYQIEKSNQLAVDLLSFMSCIEPKAIPQSILPGTEPHELEWAIGTLCSYSFLVRRGESNVFDMHSLVHVAMRNWLKKQERDRHVINNAIRHLAARFPARDDGHYGLRREFLSHALRMLNQKYEDKIVETYHLLKKVGDSFMFDRRFKEATKCYEEVCWWTKSLHSETDEIRLEAEHKLARAYLDNRQIKDAIEIFEHVVAVQETLDEKDHSRLTSEHELARAYLDNRQIKDAIEIFEHVVAVRKETLDEKDHSRLASEHELARAYLDNQQIKDAIEIFEHVVAVRKETLDEKDHSRLTSEHELARAYLDNWQIKDAIEIFEHVVAVQKETLDEKDHSRLTSEHELASAYLNNQQIKDAIEIFEHVVAVRKETLDEKDHSRLTSEHELASAYLDNGQIKDAIEIFEHVVAVDKETLDEKDYLRLTSAHELARAYLDNGQIKDAIEILESVVAIETELLAEDDYQRQVSVDLLQYCYEKHR